MDLSVEKIDGSKIVKEMAQELNMFMAEKNEALKRIREIAENVALDHKYDMDLGERLLEDDYTYHNAKKLNMLSVNTSFSTVHIPTTVDNSDPDVINAIDWSRKLEDTFKENYEHDPTMSWQYFGSSTGFLRQFPAVKWPESSDKPDMYDARMQHWYVQGAASPKDIVILLDTSASMTGESQDLAKQVALTILDTLGEDDFVTVLTYSEQAKHVMECWDEDELLVQVGQFGCSLLDNILYYRPHLVTYWS